MGSPIALRCTMSMLFCGFFWHNVVVSLNAPRRGILTISRPKVFGGKLDIALDSSANSVCLVPVTRKEAGQYQFGIRYGSWHRRAILRAPTSAIYETWWAALGTTLTVPTYVALPFAAPLIPRKDLVAILRAKPNAVGPNYAADNSALGPASDWRESAMLDDMPLLEANGPMSPGEIDVLASWRTWGSLGYFATPPGLDDRLSIHEMTGIGHDNNDDNALRAESLLYSDISEFWTRASEDETHQVVSTPICNIDACRSKPAVPLERIIPKPQHDDDEEWLNEIAHFAFQQKVGAAFMPKLRPKRQMTGQLRLHPGFTLFRRDTSIHSSQLSS